MTLAYHSVYSSNIINHLITSNTHLLITHSKLKITTLIYMHSN